MKEFVVKGAPPVRMARLDEELEAALGPVYLAISNDSRDVRVHVKDAATEADAELAESTVMAHDATVPTEEEQARAALLAFIDGLNLKAELAKIDDITDLASAKAYLKRLVRGVIKLAKLEGYAVNAEEE